MCSCCLRLSLSAGSPPVLSRTTPSCTPASRTLKNSRPFIRCIVAWRTPRGSSPFTDQLLPTIQAIVALSPSLLRVARFTAASRGDSRIDHLATVRTERHRSISTLMIHVGTQTLRHEPFSPSSEHVEHPRPALAKPRNCSTHRSLPNRSREGRLSLDLPVGPPPRHFVARPPPARRTVLPYASPSKSGTQRCGEGSREAPERGRAHRLDDLVRVRSTLSESYLHSLWIKTLHENPNLTYVATEANLPIFKSVDGK